MSENKEHIQFDTILDKIIDVTERNLSMQSEFLRAVYELKGRFDTAERDHKDMSDDIKTIVAHSSEMINKMNAASNEKIIDMLEAAKDSRAQTATTVTGAIEKIIGSLDSIKSTRPQCESYHKDVGEVAKDVKEIADQDKWIKRVLGLIALITIGFQLIFGIYSAMRKDTIYMELKQEIRQMIRSHSTK